MRFHLPALPGQPTLRSNSSCAYTQKIRRFSQMMTARGHEVFIYSGPEDDSSPTEHIVTYPLRLEPIDPGDLDAWAPHNERVVKQIRRRAEDDDLLLVPYGRCQESIARGLPTMRAVEYGIGYTGVFADFRVFESYAWMHAVAGWHAGRDGRDMNAEVGRAFDVVIPNYFDPDDFPAGDGDGGYLLFLARVTELKGIDAALQVAHRTGRRLVVAGAGDYELPGYAEGVGQVGPDRRAELLRGARALLAPTTYIEPFGGAAVEAMLCGTPVITTDWGAYTETIQHGVTGYRCRTIGEMLWASTVIEDLDRDAIRRYALANYSMDAVAPRYEAYFAQLATLDDAGWYSDWQGIADLHRYGTILEGNHADH